MGAGGVMGARGRGFGGPVVEVGSRVRFEGRAWTVAALAGGQVRLIAEDGEMVALLLRPPSAGCRRWACWSRCPSRCGSGRLPGSGTCGRWRRGTPADPVRTLAQREEAKAAELSAAGLATSAVTVRRMRARYRDGGVWGLVDQRAARPRSALGRADERVVAALRGVLEAGQERSSGTLGRLRVYTERLLAERHGHGRCRCRWLRRSTGSCKPWPTGAGCWAVRGSAAGARRGRLPRSCRRR
ncbi:hypothetical protein GCM10018782_57690 [Streptomyces griseoaurantiacus]|nr:hypothetical protein GCM10018782_57690 [Streptomyces griseoaurantiacus]